MHMMSRGNAPSTAGSRGGKGQGVCIWTAGPPRRGGGGAACKINTAARGLLAGPAPAHQICCGCILQGKEKAEKRGQKKVHCWGLRKQSLGDTCEGIWLIGGKVIVTCNDGGREISYMHDQCQAYLSVRGECRSKKRLQWWW